MQTTSVIFLGFNDPRVHVRGTENVIRVQAKSLPGRHYYVFRSNKVSCFRWSGLIVVSCPSNLLNAAIFIRILIKRIRKRRIGKIILHGHSYLLSLVASGAPLIFTIHDALYYLKNSAGARFVSLFKIVEIIVYIKSQKLHAISRYAWSQVYGRSFFTNKLTIIYNTLTVALDDCFRINGNVNRSGVVTYLVVRSIEPRANLELIVKFAHHCRETEPNAKILVAGKGPQLSYYRAVQESENLTNLNFLGYVSDHYLNTLYEEASCVILPALYGEGFGLPLIEAYARGRPAVGANICAIPEVIASHELLFENSVLALRRAVDRAQKMKSSFFLDHYNRNFSVKKTITQYRELYV